MMVETVLLARVYKKGERECHTQYCHVQMHFAEYKVKLRNITQNVPQTSGVVTASTGVATIIILRNDKAQRFFTTTWSKVMAATTPLRRS